VNPKPRRTAATTADAKALQPQDVAAKPPPSAARPAMSRKA
jgi:hypothetical protein